MWAKMDVSVLLSHLTSHRLHSAAVMSHYLFTLFFFLSAFYPRSQGSLFWVVVSGLRLYALLAVTGVQTISPWLFSSMGWRSNHRATFGTTLKSRVTLQLSAAQGCGVKSRR